VELLGSGAEEPVQAAIEEGPQPRQMAAARALEQERAVAEL
jgi:hypothetical protein